MEYLELSLNMESVLALREFSEAMPLAINNIAESTEKVIRVYQSVAENVGPHSEDFKNMLMIIKSAQENATDALSVLPGELNKTANKIEIFLNLKPNISVN